MNVVLGPCPCSTCGRIVAWDGWEWKNVSGKNSPFRHVCHELGVDRGSTWGSGWYNAGAGTSSLPRKLHDDAVPLLVPSGAASSRSGRD